MWNAQAFQYFDSSVYSHHQPQQHGGVVLAAPGDDTPPAGAADRSTEKVGASGWRILLMTGDAVVVLGSLCGFGAKVH